MRGPYRPKAKVDARALRPTAPARSRTGSLAAQPAVQAFIQRYGSYFGKARLEHIAKGGRFMVESHSEGAHLYDADGRRYLDFMVESGVFNLGHRNPAVLQAVEKALRANGDAGTFYFTKERGELANLLIETAPKGLGVVLPASGGGEGMDLAVKLAMGATQRTEIICGTRAYHGSAGLAVFAGPAHLREWFPLQPFTVKRVDLGDLEGLRKALSTQTAAVLYEPFRTLSDGYRPGRAYWSEVRRLCDRNGAKLIIDEVVAGMGRMGTLWGCDVDGVQPDLLVAAKGLSGGIFPMAAVLMRPELLESWGEVPFRSYSTFGWMNAGAVAARAAIRETKRLLPHANRMAARLEAELRSLAGTYSKLVTGVRRTGLHCVMEFNRELLTGLEFTNRMFKQGVLLHAAASIVDAPAKFFPPLILNQQHIQESLEKAETVLKQVLKSAVAPSKARPGSAHGLSKAPRRETPPKQIVRKIRGRGLQQRRTHVESPLQTNRHEKGATHEQRRNEASTSRHGRPRAGRTRQDAQFHGEHVAAN